MACMSQNQSALVLLGRWGMRLSVLAGVALWTASFGGCASGPPRSETPAVVMGDRDASAEARMRAMASALEASPPGSAQRAALRSSLREIAWDTTEPPVVRMKATELVLRDPDEPADGSMGETERFAGLLLGTEEEPGVVAVVAALATEHGWQRLTPPLLRAYSREWAGYEGTRPEPRALRSLNGERSVMDIAFEAFCDPGVEVLVPEEGAPAGMASRWRDATREDIYTLMARLDPSGEKRERLINEWMDRTAGLDEEGRGIVQALAAGARDLRAVPITGPELTWLTRLRGIDAEDPALNERWWAQAAAAIAAVPREKAPALEIRHAEPIRWAAAERPELLSMSRAGLLDRLESLQQERGVRIRTRDLAERGAAARRGERVNQQAAAMDWADALSANVLAEVVTAPGLAERLRAFVAADRADDRSELGGAVLAGDDDGFRLVLYPPRGRDRGDDDRFVASEDMIRGTDRALAHFHMQVQRPRGGGWAGPSLGDLRYAARSGRHCLVFTSVSSDELNVDYYQPDGVVIDLGIVGIGEKTGR